MQVGPDSLDREADEVKHLLEHGADGAVLAERELAYSLAEMVMATPPYRPIRSSA